MVTYVSVQSIMVIVSQSKRVRAEPMLIPDERLDIPAVSCAFEWLVSLYYIVQTSGGVREQDEVKQVQKCLNICS